MTENKATQERTPPRKIARRTRTQGTCSSYEN